MNKLLRIYQENLQGMSIYMFMFHLIYISYRNIHIIYLFKQQERTQIIILEDFQMDIRKQTLNNSYSKKLNIYVKHIAKEMHESVLV